MNTAFRLRQVWTIARLQLRRVFFSKRSFWVYLLAFFPSVIFIGHGIEVKIRRERWGSQATSPAAMESIHEGDSEEDVLKRAGQPIDDSSENRRRRKKAARRERSDEDNEPVRRHMMYFDGSRRWNLDFEAGILHNKRGYPIIDFEEDRQVFAAVFQYFYLRLAIFFGCLGIFMNLFRGEMLDKTLHFWFLAPARREVLLAGKYLAGLIAAVVIFTAGASLCFGAMLWPQDPAQLEAFWRTRGTAPTQSDSSRHYDPALGKHQRHSSCGAAEAQRALLRAVAVPGSGADRSGRAAADSPAARARRASIGYTCGAWIVRGDGAGALGGVKGGAAAGNQLWDRLSVAGVDSAMAWSKA